MSDFGRSIRDLISRYVAGSITVDELNDGLPDGWDLDEAGDPDATELALLAMGYLAGFHARHRSAFDLRAALAALVSNTLHVEYPADDMLTVLTARAGETVELERALSD